MDRRQRSYVIGSGLSLQAKSKIWMAAVAVIALSSPGWSAETTTSTSTIAPTSSSGSTNTQSQISQKLDEVLPSPIQTSLLMQTAGMLNSGDYPDASGLYLASITYTKKLKQGTLVGAMATGYQMSYAYQGGGTQTLYADTMPEGKSGDLIDPRFSVVRTFEPGTLGLDSLAAGIKGTLAGLSYASERKSQAFAVGPSVTISKNLRSYWKQLSKLTLIEKINYRYIHHHYKNQNSGKVNSPHFAGATTILDYQLGSRSSVSVSGDYSYIVSYQNTAQGILGVGLDFTYNFTDYWSGSIGVSNDTNGFASDGQTRELNLLKPESASAYLNLEIKI
jgi:hypothetical protein